MSPLWRPQFCGGFLKNFSIIDIILLFLKDVTLTRKIPLRILVSGPKVPGSYVGNYILVDKALQLRKLKSSIHIYLVHFITSLYVVA